MYWLKYRQDGNSESASKVPSTSPLPDLTLLFLLRCENGWINRHYWLTNTNPNLTWAHNRARDSVRNV